MPEMNAATLVFHDPEQGHALHKITKRGNLPQLLAAVTKARQPKRDRPTRFEAVCMNGSIMFFVFHSGYILISLIDHQYFS